MIANALILSSDQSINFTNSAMHLASPRAGHCEQGHEQKPTLTNQSGGYKSIDQSQTLKQLCVHPYWSLVTVGLSA